MKAITDVSKETLKRVAQANNNLRQILVKLNAPVNKSTYKLLKQRLASDGIDVSHIVTPFKSKLPTISRNELDEAVKTSLSYKEVKEKLSLQDKGYKTLKKRLDEEGINYDHIKGNTHYGYSIEWHGMANTTEHKTWRGLKARCSAKNGRNWDDYGGRGITVCKRWADSFLAFYEDMGARPSKAHSIDRVDNDGGYWCGKCDECKSLNRPANCRWATKREQALNTRRAHKEDNEYQKYCSVCKSTRPIADFSKATSKKFGVDNTCKDCKAAKPMVYTDCYFCPVLNYLAI